MTHNSGMVCKKINYRLNRHKIDNVRVSKEQKGHLEEYLIFCYTLPSTLLEHFAFKEVLAIGPPAVS